MANTILRTGTANTYDSSLRSITSRLSSLSALQENMTSGKKVVRASDDPTNAATAERALMRINRIATDQRALESQRNSIVLAESTLGDVTDTMNRFRELVVNAGNAVNSSAERRAIANELQGLREQVLSLANRTDTNGAPLFSALGSALAPFVGPAATSPDYTFNGLPGQLASSDVAIPYSLDGDGAFMHQPLRDQVFNTSIVPAGTAHALSTGPFSVSNSATVSATSAAASASTGIANSYPSYSLQFTGVDTSTTPGTTSATYTVTETPVVSGALGPFTATGPSNQALTITGLPGLSFSLRGTPVVGDKLNISASASVFSVMDNAIRDIGGATNNNTASQAVSQALYNLDIGMERISAVRGQAGDLLNRADRITANQSSRNVQLETDRSRAQDLDMLQAISDFNNQQTGYQAALQSYAQVQKLSLFNYIG
jgi:flagellar hook-associated protein 3 FlgL